MTTVDKNNPVADGVDQRGDRYLETPDPAPRPAVGKPPYREEIIGPTFSLRRLSTNTVPEPYLEWLHDPEIIRFLQVRFDARTPGAIEKFIESFDHLDTFLFGIYSSTEDDYIGNITLSANPHHLFASMGYLIGDKRFWKTDAAIEAVKLICDFAFFERGLRKIFEMTTANHIASNFNFRRLGFSYGGKIPDLYWGEGKYHAATIWTMDAVKWAEIRSVPTENVTP